MSEAWISHQKADRPSRRPVFLTGLPRCGSSWVGEVLGGAPDLRYVYEPFNSQWAPSLQGRLAHFRYLPADHGPWPVLEQAAQRALRGNQGMKQLLRAARRGYLRSALRRSGRVLIKDPTGVLLTDWLAERFDTQVLVIVRHPCGFASSIRQLGWTIKLERLLEQESLMADHLSAYEPALRSAMGDPWTELGAFWAAVHAVLARQARHRGDWAFRHYEDLCLEPETAFASLAGDLGIALPKTLPLKTARTPRARFDPGSTRRDSRSMAGIWRQRMSGAQIDAVCGVVREFDTDLSYEA